jgi:hypothetical protein
MHDVIGRTHRSTFIRALLIFKLSRYEMANPRPQQEDCSNLCKAVITFRHDVVFVAATFFRTLNGLCAAISSELEVFLKKKFLVYFDVKPPHFQLQ